MTRPMRRVGKWALYSALILLSMMIETVFLADTRIWGTKLALVPVALACVAAQEDAEAGGLFALLASLFWFYSGNTDSSLCILTLTFSCLLAGFFCGGWLTKNLLPVALFCLVALITTQGGTWLTGLYLQGDLPAGSGILTLRQIGLSLLTTPVYWAVTHLIGKL